MSEIACHEASTRGLEIPTILFLPLFPSCAAPSLHTHSLSPLPLLTSPAPAMASGSARKAARGHGDLKNQPKVTS